MDLIDEALSARIDQCSSSQKLPEQSRAAGTVDSGQARHNATAPEHELFRLAQNATCRSSWFRRAEFGHPLTVFLRVNARAAREKQKRSREDRGEVLRSFEIDLPVIFRVPTAGTRAMNDRVEIPGRRSDCWRGFGYQPRASNRAGLAKKRWRLR